MWFTSEPVVTSTIEHLDVTSLNNVLFIPGAVVGIGEDGLISYRVYRLGTTIVRRVRDIVITKPGPLHEDDNQLPPEPSENPDQNAQATA